MCVEDIEMRIRSTINHGSVYLRDITYCINPRILFMTRDEWT